MRTKDLSTVAGGLREFEQFHHRYTCSMIQNAVFHIAGFAGSLLSLTDTKPILWVRD